MKPLKAAAVAVLALLPLAASAAEFPAPKQSEWIVRDFKFHTGEVLPELRLAYTTVGEPTGEPVLVLHGTTGSAANMLTPIFAGELYGAGQPLDASKYYIIIPMANRPSRPTGCALNSRSTIMTTWSRRSTGCSPSI